MLSCVVTCRSKGNKPYDNKLKSLLAKAIGRTYGLPIIRLDIGKIMDKFVGSSERNMRQVINVIEAVGKSVIHIAPYRSNSV
jgi:SpoVK/Ycf46/Vps4 family AAA+-type ATPase